MVRKTLAFERDRSPGPWRNRLTLLAGNHDASTMREELRPRLLEMLGLDLAAPFENLSWFIRRGPVHIEHGHVHDPDNAPAHPLAAWSPETEPLGIALTRRFLSPNDAFTFAHAHHTTPLQGLTHTFKTFGLRAPWMVIHYFATSGRLAAEAAVPERMGAVKARGSAALADFAKHSGLSEDTLRELLGRVPRPTHEDFRDTFFRLYFDRVLATQFGNEAASLVRQQRFDQMVVLASGSFGSVPLADVAARTRRVTPDHPLLRCAEQIGICLGR